MFRCEGGKGIPTARIILNLGVAIMGLVTVGCQALPKLGKPKPSTAVAPVRNPAFVVDTDASRGRAAGVSSAACVENGPDAFAIRVAMARFARQSLDMQYFIWDGDQTGTYLLSEVLDAADRGVRVRLLLDDQLSHGLVQGVLQQLAAGARAVSAEIEDNLALVTPQAMQRRNRMRHLMDEIHSGGRDLVGAALDTHPNIEVRMFNPNATRGGIARILHMIADFSRLNRRMHNKIFAADNQLAVVGGRNIADVYYGMHAEHNWRDLDLLVRGPVVQDISSSFDLYWNSEWAVPVSAFSWEARSSRRLADLREELDLFFEGEKDARLRALDADPAVAATLRRVSAQAVETPISVVADLPVKFSGSGKPLVADALGVLSDASQKEILVESAYFVPEKRTFARMQQRLNDGVAVRTLTNSLASTNHMSVHAAYVSHRKDLLRSGVEMHELKSAKGDAALFGFLVPDSRAGIHTKAVVFDRSSVFVGTFNLDPRSVHLNTEIGLLAESPALSEQVAAFIQQGMQPDRSWRVQLGEPGAPEKGGDRLYWISGDPANPQITSHEPDTGFLKRLLLKLVSWLPVDSLL